MLLKKTLIIFNLLLFVNGFAQLTTIKDTLWIEDFEDGNFDQNIFKNAVFDYNATVENEGTFDIFGKVLKLNIGSIYGGVSLGIKLQISTQQSYDSIVLFAQQDYLTASFVNPSIISFTFQDPFDPNAISYKFTSSIPHISTSMSGARQKVCENCTGVDIDNYADGLHMPTTLHSYIVNTIYEGPYDFPHYVGDTLDYEMANVQDLSNPQLREDFCNLCSTNFGQSGQDYNLYNMCTYLAEIPNFNNVEIYATVGSVALIGYRQGVTTGLNIISTESPKIIKYYDLTGLEIVNREIENEIVVAEYSNATRKLIYLTK